MSNPRTAVLNQVEDVFRAMRGTAPISMPDDFFIEVTEAAHSDARTKLQNSSLRFSIVAD
jgi:hypothetical protein